MTETLRTEFDRLMAGLAEIGPARRQGWRRALNEISFRLSVRLLPWRRCACSGHRLPWRRCVICGERS